MNFFKKFEKLKVKYKTNKKRILSITVTAVGIACLLIGSSMAYLLFEASGTTQTISAGTLQLSYTNESEAIILNNAVPQSDEQGLNNNVYSITLTNTSTIKSYYELSLNNNCTVGNSYTVNGSSVTANVCIPNNYLKVAVKTNKDEDYTIKNGGNVILKGYLEAKENISFEMIIWLTEETPNDYQGQTETGTPRNVIYNGNFKIYTRQLLGNEYTITNMIKNGNFEKDAANWALSGASITSDEKYSGEKSLMLSPNTTAMSTQTLSSTAPVLNHKYYGSIMYKTASGLTAADNRFEWYNTDNSDALMVFANKKDTQGKWERLSGIGQITSTSYLDKSWYVRNFMVNATTNSYVDEVMIVDLTETFGAGNEPTKEWCDENINYFEGTTIITKKEAPLDTSGANNPVLASNMIPVYYDETEEVWKKADANNKNSSYQWYSYESNGDKKGMWANAVTVTSTNRTTYLNAAPGTVIPMTDINTMWVWIPRFNAITPSNYNGGTKDNPGAIDVTFTKVNETAIDAFTFGNKEISGFWYGKFEVSHSTLASSTTANNLGCTTTTCSNANGIIIKPNVSSLRRNSVSNFFFASRSMEQTGNSFGFVSSEVDTHMSKNNEWGAVAYLTQSIYGRCSNSTTCSEVYINNSSGYYTGRSGGNVGGSTPINGTYTDQTSKTQYNTYGFYTYDDYLLNYNTNTKGNKVQGKGTGASTTGTIYGIYDMSGGANEYVMGVLADTSGNPRSGYVSSNNSGFTGMLSDGTTYTGIAFPDSKYYNLYTGTSYTGHALTETKNWYSDVANFFNTSYPWLLRGGSYNYRTAGVFSFGSDNGNSYGDYSSRLVISNK